MLISVSGLAQISKLTWRGSRIGASVAYLVGILCVAPFLFWWTIHLADSEDLSPVLDYEASDYINYGDPEGRIAINQQLLHAPGKQLVFVQYSPSHRFREWIHNAADIDASRVVWAHDLGPSENTKLLQYYPHRTAWLLQPDANPPQLSRYKPEPTPTTTPFQSLNP